MKPRTAVVPAVLLAGLLGLAACGGGGGDGSDSGASSEAGGSADVAAAQADGRSTLSSTYDAFTARGPADQEKPVQVQRSVIRKANVELRSDDVGKAQFEVQQLTDRLSGQVSQEETTTDDDGKPAYTRMVLRIPTDSFATAMDDLKAVDGAELVSASSGENDVTAKVIDTQTRLAAQRRSIARITVLFDRAQSIRDIVRIESELSRRQADLESLERQAAYLRGQTSMSTITVSIDQTPAKAKKDTDDAGFVTGLKAGWDALATSAVGLATALGALLPWLVVLGIVGIPALLIWRSRRRVTPTPDDPGQTPSAA
ncbi:hypothetical protein GCM10027062_17230 [Nocardioides hungaricus]